MSVSLWTLWLCVCLWPLLTTGHTTLTPDPPLTLGSVFCVQPENIMLSEKVLQPNIKLIDFGLAQRLQQGQEYRSCSGTPQYIGEFPMKYICKCVPHTVHSNLHVGESLHLCL